MSGWLDDTTGRHTASVTSVGGGTVPTYSTSQKKFGSSSAYFDMTDNETGGVITLPDSDDWAFSNTWSINFWFYPTRSYVTYLGFFSTWQTNGMKVYLRDSNFRPDSRFSTSTGTAATDTAAGAPTNYAWNHLAMSRDSSYWRLWLNGTLRYIHDISGAHAGTHTNVSNPLRIGAMNDASTLTRPYPFDGYLDGFHIEDGVSNWTGTSTGVQYFDPGTLTEPTVTAYSVLLMNFNETFYQVQGNLSHEARVTVTDEDSRTIEYDDVVSAGSYAIDVDDNSLKTVVAVRESDGELLGYGRVTPTQL